MNVRRVPAYLDIDGVKTEIGTAVVDLDMGCATVTVNHASASHILQDKAIDTFSVAPEKSCNDHKPIQHRDSKPPWCNKCGLTVDYEIPVGRLRGDQESSATHHDFLD